ncbi:MAG TPA: tetratricopeptide repeat protein [Burkholderiaceae bacterium]
MTIIASTERTRDLSAAIRHHMEGHYDEAEKLYTQLREANPHDEEVLYLTGVLCCDLGIFAPARRFLEQALNESPVFPEAGAQLVKACAGDAQQAIGQNDFTAAEAACRRALQLDATAAIVWRTLGQMALMKAAWEQAEACLQRALQGAPDDLDALNWHGLACVQLQKFAQGRASLERLLALRPELPQAQSNLGLCLLGLGELQPAEACFQRVLQLAPGDIGARINLANTLRIRGKAEEARSVLESVIRDAPQSAEALNNLGTVLQDLGQAQAASERLEAALKLAPDSAQVRWNLSLSQLLLGMEAAGWANFEARWEGCANLAGAYSKPRARAWQGESVQGKVMLLWAEQGFGDTLQFIRFAQALAERGATVVAEVQPELQTLIAGVPGISQAIARGQDLPDYDFHCPLMSLPLHLGPGSYGTVPYLHTDRDRAALWKTKLEGYRRPRIGLVWAGKSRLQNAELDAIDRRRSISLTQLAPLTTVPDCSFFSLQKGGAAIELRNIALPIHDFSAQWQDFADTAAFIDNLDLVISVDTAVAHLAGALGKPVWLLNRFDTCWRWGKDRMDTPWYPSVRQFRQAAPGNWETPLKEVMAALKDYAIAPAKG